VGGSSTGVRGGGGGRSIAQRKEDKRSLGSQFKMQLGELVGLIESGRAHYVRCIKPNGLRRYSIRQHTSAYVYQHTTYQTQRVAPV
jgi:hypothetical protein